MSTLQLSRRPLASAVCHLFVIVGLLAVAPTAKATVVLSGDAQRNPNGNNDLFVGITGVGGAVQSSGGDTLNNVDVGVQGGGNGTFNILGGSFTANQQLNIGVSGQGTATVSGTVNADRSSIGVTLGGQGELDVSGGLLELTDFLSVGADGRGELIIRDQGKVRSTVGTIGGGVGATGDGTVTITGEYAELRSAADMVFAHQGTMDVTVEDKGRLIADADVYLANDIGSMGTLNVLNDGSLTANNGIIYVGHGGDGVLDVDNATVEADSLVAGDFAPGVADIVVRNGGLVETAGDFVVGGHGEASMDLQDNLTHATQGLKVGGRLTVSRDGDGLETIDGDDNQGRDGTLGFSRSRVEADSLWIGANVGSHGFVDVNNTHELGDGTFTNLTVANELIVGNAGIGRLDSHNTIMTSRTGVIGVEETNTGLLSVVNLNVLASWTVLEDLVIGDRGIGSLYMDSNAQLEADNARVVIGSQAGGEGFLTLLRHAEVEAGQLIVGSRGDGLLTIDGTVPSPWGPIGKAQVVVYQSMTVGEDVGGDGEVILTGKDGFLNTETLTVGGGGSGTMFQDAGADSRMQWLKIGDGATGVGLVSVSGAGAGVGDQTVMDIVGSTLDKFDAQLSVGIDGHGELLIDQGAVVNVDDGVFVGERSSNTGIVTVDNANLEIDDRLWIGLEGAGEVHVRNGGVINTSRPDGEGVLTLGAAATGEGALYIESGGTVRSNDTIVAQAGTAFLRIDDGTLLSGDAVSSGAVQVGAEIGSFGQVVIEDGGQWQIQNGQFLVGVQGEADVEVRGAGSVVDTYGSSTVIADAGGALGSLRIIDGAELYSGGLTIGAGYHDPGYGQNAPALGELIIDGGTVNSGAASLGERALGGGFASVVGGNWWINGGDLLVGNEGAGLVEIGSGGTVDSNGNDVQIAAAGGSQGRIDVLGGGALEAGSLTIGGGYHDPGYGQNAPALGELNIDGGSVNSGAVSMGDTALGDGFASVRNGDWRINGGDLLVGNQGIGLVEIGGGGTVDTTGNVVQIAAAGGSQGQVEVLAGGTLEAGDLIIGGGYLDPGYGQNAPAVGNLIIDGGTVNSGGVSMGETALGDGFASVRNGDWRINGGSLQVGYEGIGQIEIGDGGTVDTNGNGMQIAAVGGSQGQVDVLNGGMLHAGGLIIGGGDGVGPDAFGSLNIDGGVVNSTSANVGNLFNGVGDVSIDNGTWNAGANVNFGHQGIGDARIGAGGVLNSQFINIGRESTGIGEVDVDGGTINLTGDGGNGGFANVGRFGDGTLRVRNGGWVNLTAVGVDFPGINIGREAGSTGLVEVTGTTSRITIDGDQPGLFQAGLIQVGRGGDGTLKVLDGGQVLNDPDGIVVLGARSGATGSLLVDGTGALLDAGNTLQIGRFDGTSLGVAQVSDGGVIRALTVEVNANGLLMGDGTVIGNVDNVGGTVAMGNSPGLLTVQGDYSQSAAGTMEVELAGFVFDPGNGVVEYDVLDVMGDVFLDGVLDLLVETNFMALLHVGDVFEVIRGQSISGAFANILNADLGSGRFFRAVYNATSVHLVVAAVPAPGGIALFGLALAVLAVRRRRRA